MNAFMQGRTLSSATASSCGQLWEDWLHILCECQLMGRWIGTGVVDTPERMRLLGVFVDVAFLRRRMAATRDEPQAPER